MDNDLRKALEEKEFYLNYQPIIDPKEMTVVGVEALLRWNNAGTIIPASEFIPILEKNKLFIPIGEWIIRTAYEQCKKWQTMFSRPFYISVNLSAIEFKSANILKCLTEVLNDTGLDPTCLMLELTETTLLENIENNIQILNNIKGLGIKISIDDFGTGYSSLSYLSTLPIDYLKIDRSFINDMLNKPKAAAIVKTIIELGENLTCNIIAEGVETQKQFSYLENLGHIYIQGYYFSHPLETDNATIFLQKNKLLRGLDAE